MKEKMKAFNFRFSERDLAALDRIVDSIRDHDPALWGWKLPNRSEIIRWLIRLKDGEIETEARKKFEAELQARKEKTLVKPKQKRGA
jgi:hypothetical protein